jgi:type I restriction enzyme S subunit
MSAAKQKYKPYPKYKNSGVDWLGQVPEHWSLLPGRRLFTNRKDKAKPGDEQLTASQQYGVIPQKLYSELSSHRVVAALKGTEAFNHVAVNDFVISLRSFQGGIERCRYSGCITPAYTILSYAKGKFDERYFEYLMKSTAFIQKLQSLTDNLRDGKPISYDSFGGVLLPFTPSAEQTAIADFIERECGRMDKLVEKKQQFIALLKEKRQALITHAVTKGLNPKAKMKDSGVEWLGMVPEHWEVKPLWSVVSCNEFVIPDNTLPEQTIRYVDISSVSYDKGIEHAEEMDFASAPSRARRLAQAGDIIVSTVRTYLRAIAVVTKEFSDCIFSTGFAVLHPLKPEYQPILNWIVLSDGFIGAVVSHSEGISYPAINASQLTKFKVATPPPKEIEAISTFLVQQTSRIDRLLTKTEKSIDLLKERKTALITAAVTGQIDVSQSA